MEQIKANVAIANIKVTTHYLNLHGKVIIIHDKPDDFTTQPSGNSGNKIACGEIVAL